MPTYDEYKRFTDAIYTPNVLDEAIGWIQDNLNPDEVYLKDTLDEWALNNGFIREEE